MSDRDSIAKTLMEQQAMSDLGTNMQQPFDAAQLIGTGAVRVVRHPDDTTDDPERYSLVTHWNDMQPNSPTTAWPNKPGAYAAAQRDLANPNSGALYNGKLRQIMWSAGQRGPTPVNY